MVRRSAHNSGLSTYFLLDLINLKKIEPTFAPASSILTSNTPLFLSEPRPWYAELFGAGITCVSMGIGIATTLGAIAAAPATGGAALIVAFPAGAGTAAVAAQCGMGVGRLINVLTGNGLRNVVLESNDFYVWVVRVLDIASLLQFALPARSSIKVIEAYNLATQGLQMRAKQRILQAILAGLPPADKRLFFVELKNALEQTTRMLTPAQLKQIQRALVAGKITGLEAAEIGPALSKLLAERTRELLRDSLLTVASALPPAIGGSASGNLYTYFGSMFIAQER